MSLNPLPEVFDWQGIRIRQHPSVHKVGTDAVLLGGWIAQVIPEAERILDVGTGSGILALMSARNFPHAIIHAIDCDLESVELANYNVSNAGLENNIWVRCEDILEPPGFDSAGYDLVISNPPFYSTGIIPVSEAKARAKHSIVPEARWIAGMQNRLKKNGQMCIIVPAASAVHWIREANILGYYNLKRMDIFSFPEDPFPRRSLLYFAHTLSKPDIGQMAIYAKENTYTKEYLQLTGIRATKETTGLHMPLEE